jgi:hypothetical protein
MSGKSLVYPEKFGDLPFRMFVDPVLYPAPNVTAQGKSLVYNSQFLFRVLRRLTLRHRVLCVRRDLLLPKK